MVNSEFLLLLIPPNRQEGGGGASITKRSRCLVTGHKNLIFLDSGHMSLSGGVCVCAAALGANRVHGDGSMPHKWAVL